MHAEICKTRGGVVGACSPRKILGKLDALRLLLRSFWDRSRAVVAIWLVEYCIQFLAVTYAFAKPAGFEFPREKVLRLPEQQVG